MNIVQRASILQKRIPRTDLLAYYRGGTDTIGLSVSDYEDVDPLLRSIFFVDETTLRDGADAVTLALASPYKNQITMIATADKVLLYKKDTDATTLARAYRYARLTLKTQPQLTANPAGATMSMTLALPLPAAKTVGISWGDGDVTTVTGAVTETDYAHTYSTAGAYTVKILGDYSSLTYLKCNDPHPTGDIAWISKLTNIAYLRLCPNSALTGSISVLSGLTSLTYIALHKTSVSGDISALSGLALLDALYIYETTVTGDIGSLATLTALDIMYLYKSSVSSYTSTTLPAWGGSVAGIRVYDLSLDVTEVSNFLIDLAAAGGTNGYLDISGDNAAPDWGTEAEPSDAALAVVLLLQRTWTVTVTGGVPAWVTALV